MMNRPQTAFALMLAWGGAAWDLSAMAAEVPSPAATASPVAIPSPQTGPPGITPAPVPSPAPAQAPVATAAPSKVALGAAFQFYTLDYIGGNPVAGAYPIGWNRFMLFPNAQVNPELSFRARLVIDNFGISNAGIGSGHLRTSTLDTGSPFYLDWSYVSFKPTGHTWHVGLLNLIHETKIGSSITTPFDSSAVYSVTLSRYGGVGTPPLTASQTLDAAPNRPGNWLMGTNVALETLDPNSSFSNFPSPALAAIYQTRLEDTLVTLATMDGTSGVSLARARDLTVARSLYLPANYPFPAGIHDGYSLALVERRFPAGRVQVGLRADNNTFGTGQGKYSSLTVETGDEQMAASFTLAGSGLPTERVGAYVWRDGLNGFGLGLGAKASGMLFLRTSPYPFLSYGPIVRTPAIGWMPRWTLSLQETRGASWEALASGVSLETTFQPHPALPVIRAEYSVGKFDPAGGNALLDFSRPFSHQLYSILTTVSF